MPLTPGAPVSDTIRELHGGRTFKHTAAKFGKADAQRQSIAIALSNARKGHASGGVVQGFDLGGGVNPQMMAAMAAMAQRPMGGMPPNQFNHGLTTNPGVAPQPPMPMGTPGQMTPPMGQPAPTGVAQPPSPVGTTPSNPMARPLMAKGGALHRWGGGFNMSQGPNLMPTWQEKQEARGMMHVGAIPSIVPGRTDNHHAFVPSGSYVLPASHISSMGQGNSVAGLAMAHNMFGMPDMPIKHGMGAPRPPRPPRVAGMMHTGGAYSEGGARGDGDHKPVEVMLSGGEFVISPQVVRRIGKGSLKNGHRILDAWVMAQRKKEIKTQQNLPPPAKR